MKKILGLFLTTLSFSLTAQAADFTISLVPVQHNHEVSEVNGLQSLLNDKASNASVALKANQSDLTSGLAGKVNTSTLSSYVAKTDVKLPTVQKFTYTGSTGSYSPPVGTLYVRVRMVGGGGGGGASGTSGSPFVDGGIGGATSFAGSVAAGGGGALAASGGVSYGGAAGLPTIASGHLGSGFAGSYGAGGTYIGASGIYASGGLGGSSFFGGVGRTSQGGPPLDAAPNSGSGGSGGGHSSSGTISGAGGGAGAYVDVIIPASLLTAPVSYMVGNKGLGSLLVGGNTGNKGSDGGTGYIEVTEYYQ